MSRLVWLLAGLVGGVIVGRNAQPMTSPAGSAVVLALLAGCGLCWLAAYRGKSQAVASAVAVAQASASADAEAEAAAIAQAAVHLHLSQLPTAGPVEQLPAEEHQVLELLRRVVAGPGPALPIPAQQRAQPDEAAQW